MLLVSFLSLSSSSLSFNNAPRKKYKYGCLFKSNGGRAIVYHYETT